MRPPRLSAARPLRRSRTPPSERTLRCASVRGCTPSRTASDRAPSRRRLPGRDELAVELAGDLCNLWPTCVSGLLKDGRYLRVGDEVLPALRVPVEQHPDPALLVGVVKDARTLGAVLLTLLEACGREHTPPAVEILDLRC